MASTNAPLALTAYETLLLCSDEHVADSRLLIRSRLGISSRQERCLSQFLLRSEHGETSAEPWSDDTSIISSAENKLARGRPFARALLLLNASERASVVGCESEREDLTSFMTRQRALLVSVLAEVAPDVVITTSVGEREAGAPPRLAGWWDKGPGSSWLPRLPRWQPRYVELRHSMLCWAHDERGTRNGAERTNAADEIKVEVRKSHALLELLKFHATSPKLSSRFCARARRRM